MSWSKNDMRREFFGEFYKLAEKYWDRNLAEDAEAKETYNEDAYGLANKYCDKGMWQALPLVCAFTNIKIAEVNRKAAGL